MRRCAQHDRLRYLRRGQEFGTTSFGVGARISAWTGKAILLVTCVLVAVGAMACAPATSPRAGGELTVAAASDLQFAFTEVGRQFEEETGAKVTFLFGSSGNLSRQIENGAPVDLFASADEGYVRRLISVEAVIPDTEQLYALGRIALVSSKASGTQLSSLEDLLDPAVKRITLANPDHAPYGLAAKQALESAGLWDRIQPKVVYGENVRQTLQLVQTGNAEAGLVALSIADVSEVEVVRVDETLYQPLRQSLVVVKGSRQETLARQFAAFVKGPKGSIIMERYGFDLPVEG